MTNYPDSTNIKGDKKKLNNLKIGTEMGIIVKVEG